MTVKEFEHILIELGFKWVPKDTKIPESFSYWEYKPIAAFADVVIEHLSSKERIEKAKILQKYFQELEK